ncbi:MAG TPA: Gfo/Idh/MocA family oxidoreductase, partial [Spirochaetia bacterium]|nr:Gfo/Idh/MocA family oxidoreductase [Spirochaetia bacterium]
MPGKRIRVGVIGYGGTFDMAKVHLGEMRKAGMSPVAVADIDLERLSVARRDFPGIRTYPSARDLLQDSELDLVTIVTPHDTHARLALQCLRAGKHVVCEKPMAITTAECDAMIRAARERKLLLSTYHNRHWDGWILNAMKLIRAGRIGDVVRVDGYMGQWAKPGDWWRSSKSISGGILYDWGVHLLEYTLQMVDSSIVEVSGYARSGVWAKGNAWNKDTIEDEGFIVVRYASGAWSTLLVTALDAAPRAGWFHVTGTRGTLEFDSQGWKLTTVPDAGRGAPVTATLSGRNPDSEWWRFYKNIAAHLTRGEKL